MQAKANVNYHATLNKRSEDDMKTPACHQVLPRSKQLNELVLESSVGIATNGIVTIGIMTCYRLIQPEYASSTNIFFCCCVNPRSVCAKQVFRQYLLFL